MLVLCTGRVAAPPTVKRLLVLAPVKEGNNADNAYIGPCARQFSHRGPAFKP